MKAQKIEREKGNEMRRPKRKIEKKGKQDRERQLGERQREREREKEREKMEEGQIQANQNTKRGHLGAVPAGGLPVLLLRDGLGCILGSQLEVRGDVAAEAVARRAGAAGTHRARVGDAAGDTGDQSMTICVLDQHI